MSEITDDELRNWALKSKYAKYADNLALIKILWQKEHGKTASTSYSGETVVKIKDIKKEGEVYTIQGIVAQKKSFSYEGCPLCLKKECEHMADRVSITMINFLVGDETGMIWCAMRDKGNLVLEEGRKVQVRGKTKRWKNSLEIMAYEVNTLE